MYYIQTYFSAHMKCMSLVISNMCCLTSYFVTEIRPPYWSMYITNLRNVLLSKSEWLVIPVLSVLILQTNV